MELKKNPRADLDKSRSIFILIGFVFAVGILFTLFSWRTESSQLADLGSTRLDGDIEMAEITRPDEPKIEKLQEQPEDEQKTDVIDIMPDDSENKDNSFFDNEFSENDKYELIKDDLDDDTGSEIPFISVEKMPVYPGGEAAMIKHIFENIVYPQQALEIDLQGTVNLRFVVLQNGKVGKVEIIRGVDPLLDKEAERVVKTLKDFTPGEQGGKKVKVWFSVPIVFRISN